MMCYQSFPLEASYNSSALGAILLRLRRTQEIISLTLSCTNSSQASTASDPALHSKAYCMVATSVKSNLYNSIFERFTYVSRLTSQLD
jgi:hypothetical protein